MTTSAAALKARRVAADIGGWLAPLLLGLAIGLSTVQPIATFAIMGAVLGLLFLGMPRNEPVVVVAFAVLCMPKLVVPGMPLPLNETLMVASVLIAALHPRGRLDTAPWWLTAALWSLLSILVLSTVLNQLFTLDATKRLVHVAVFVAVVVGLARGRIPLRATLTGLLAGISLSAVSGLVGSFTGFGSSSYEGRLTGLFDDPNVAGLMLAVLGPLALMRVTAPRLRRTVLALLGLATVLTLSRTTLLAVVVVFIWMLVGKRLRAGAAASLLMVLIASIAFIPSSIQSIGPFSDRGGSDQLRERVTASEWESVGESPIIGHGAGSAVVRVNADRVKFFFHDSYLALAQEGGYLALGTYLIALVVLFVSLLKLRLPDRSPWIEASLIALAVCAINLGEVLLDLTAAAAIGVAARHLVLVTRRGAIGSVEQTGRRLAGVA